MDDERAKEIIFSPIMYEVTYNGVPIYIESINSDNATANIHFFDQPNSSQKVSISSLIEQQKIIPDDPQMLALAGHLV